MLPAVGRIGRMGPGVVGEPNWALPGGLYADYRKSIGSPILRPPSATDTHAANHLAQTAAGSFLTFLPNVPVITDLGWQTSPTRVQLHPDPADFSTANWTRGACTPTQDIAIGGLVGSTITEAGSTSFLRTASTFAVVSASTYTAVFSLKQINSDWLLCTVRDSTLGTNAIRVWVNLATRTKGTVTAVGTGYGHVSSEVIQSSNGQDCYLVVVFTAPTTAVCVSTSSASADAVTSRNDIGGGAGIGSAYGLGFVNVYLGGFAVPPILSAATVAGNQPVIGGLGTLLANGVGGFVQVDLRQPSPSGSNVQILNINDGTGANRLNIYMGANEIRVGMDASSAGQGNIAVVGAYPGPGIFTIAFAFSTNFIMGRAVGYAAPSPDVSATYPVVNRAWLGGRPSSFEEPFQSTRKLALVGGAQDATTFAAIYEKAVLAAAA